MVVVVVVVVVVVFESTGLTTTPLPSQEAESQQWPPSHALIAQRYNERHCGQLVGYAIISNHAFPLRERLWCCHDSEPIEVRTSLASALTRDCFISTTTSHSCVLVVRVVDIVINRYGSHACHQKAFCIDL